ncbi:MAG: hypothetical protein ACREB9_03475, partial [Thermoplasmata archaeon]
MPEALPFDGIGVFVVPADAPGDPGKALLAEDAQGYALAGVSWVAIEVYDGKFGAAPSYPNLYQQAEAAGLSAFPFGTVHADIDIAAQVANVAEAAGNPTTAILRLLGVFAASDFEALAAAVAETSFSDSWAALALAGQEEGLRSAVPEAVMPEAFGAIEAIPTHVAAWRATGLPIVPVINQLGVANAAKLAAQAGCIGLGVYRHGEPVDASAVSLAALAFSGASEDPAPA